MGYSPWGHKEPDTSEVTNTLASRCVTQSLPSSSRGILPVSVSLSKFPLFIRTQSHWIRAHPADLIFT